VGYHTSDDAGIYKLTEELAIVTTADFITPPVDDPYVFGQIAAANAISDVYAMGGRPITCLNLVSFPSKKLPAEQLHQIIAGALSKITESGAVLAGGHSIEDDEPKFGLAVTGIVHPEHFWTNTGVRPGDVLILTKPIGSGVLFNANLKNWVSTAAMEACLAVATALNRTAAETLQRFSVHGATDITGFGISGHAMEMARGSQVCLSFETDAIPTMSEALAMYKKGMNTGVNAHNRRLVQGGTRIDTPLEAWHEEILYDPQTSGGLLAALPAEEGPSALEALHAKGVSAARIIGQVLEVDNGTHLIFK
jgi:selenide,water dikinase